MIDFYPYTKEFEQIFKDAKERLKKSLPKVEIHHIGSTAVEGLGGKGIVDILIGLDDWEKREKVKNELKCLGYTHIHPEENGRIFMSKKPEAGYKDTHLHLVKKGEKEFREKLALRDFLRENPAKAKEYEKLKRKIIKKTEGEREDYRKTKNNYLKKIIEEAKKD